jgi:Protein of unknown function (DUF3105)
MDGSGTPVAAPALPSASVASRQQEKERRRQERLARERTEAAAAARRKRLQLALGGVLGLALVAGLLALAVGSLGGSDSSAKQAAATPVIKLPPQRTSSVTVAAKAAGCVVSNPPIEGRLHEAKDFKPSDYRTNPPTSGHHNPDWYQDGIYEPGSTPRLGMLVHPLEHGRIEVQYKPGTPKRVEQQLESFFSEQNQGYHMLLFQNTTGMRYRVAATAWGHLLGCPRMNDRVFDALRTFRAAYIDKGPEIVP